MAKDGSLPSSAMLALLETSLDVVGVVEARRRWVLGSFEPAPVLHVRNLDRVVRVCDAVIAVLGLGLIIDGEYMS